MKFDITGIIIHGYNEEDISRRGEGHYPPHEVMTLFLFTFFLLYGGVHLYVFLRTRAALSLGTSSSVVLAVFFALMVSTPAVIRTLERAGDETSARVAADVGYTWLGIIFLFSSCAVALDLWRLLIRLAGRLPGIDLSVLSPSARQLFFIPLIYCLLASAYGFVEALSIRTEKITVETPKVPVSAGRFRIVQISDVHLGLIIREERLRRIMEKVRDAGPDLLVSTGDLVDGQLNRLDGLSGLLRQSRPRYGRYAITGNHEYFAGIGNAVDFTDRSGFELLQGRAVSVTDFLSLAGVDDPAARYTGRFDPSVEEKVLLGLPRERFVLLLKHRPLVSDSSAGLFDLQLSGHVHRGQIFPFSILTWLYYKHQSGLAQVAERSWLYVSRGTGTWGPPIRFLSPPEITVIDLVHGDHAVKIMRER